MDWPIRWGQQSGSTSWFAQSAAARAKWNGKAGCTMSGLGCPDGSAAVDRQLLRRNAAAREAAIRIHLKPELHLSEIECDRVAAHSGDRSHRGRTGRLIRAAAQIEERDLDRVLPQHGRSPNCLLQQPERQIEVG